MISVFKQRSVSLCNPLLDLFVSVLEQSVRESCLVNQEVCNLLCVSSGVLRMVIVSAMSLSVEVKEHLVRSVSKPEERSVDTLDSGNVLLGLL